jgi:hypothetical protein
VLNRSGKPVNGFFISGTYTHNNLQNPFILMRKQGDFEPVVKNDEHFNLYYFQFGYNRILNRLQKN